MKSLVDRLKGSIWNLPPLAIWDGEIVKQSRRDKKGKEYLTFTTNIPKDLIDTNVLQQGQKVIVAVWQEGRV